MLKGTVSIKELAFEALQYDVKPDELRSWFSREKLVRAVSTLDPRNPNLNLSLHGKAALPGTTL